MSDLVQIFLTSALTLIGGTLLFLFGEFIKVLVVVPLQKYKEQVQLTFDRLDFYANRVTNFFSAEPTEEEWELMQQISGDFRSAATQLSSRYANISLRTLLTKFKIIPSAEKLKEAYGSLILLSNNLPREGRDSNKEIDPIMINHEQIEKVRSALTV